MIKQKLLSLCVALLATTALWAKNNVITYTATSKLPETVSEYDGGLHTDSFNVKVSSHTFSNGVGIITFAGEVTIIGERAFDGCYDMTSITIPNSVIKIGKYAFMNCWSMTLINMSDNVTEIDDETFYNCSALRSMIIPSVTTKIGRLAFFNCQSLTSINIPSSVTTIGERAFYGCKGINSIKVDSTNTHYCSIDSVLFSYARDTLILYPIGNNRTEYIIPNSVAVIGDYAFAGCSSLESIVFSYSVTMIEEMALYYCTGLTSITCYAKNPPICVGNCFFEYYHIDTSIPLYVPAQSVAAYKVADGWTNFTNIQGICEGVPSFSQQDTTICGHPYPFVWEGDTIRYGGEVDHWTSARYNSEVWSWRDRIDTITRNYISASGCDSILQLVVRYPHYQYSIYKDTIEEGQSFWGKYTKTGIYYDRNLNVQGCDSNVYEIHLYVQPKPVYVVTLSANSTKYGSVEGAGTYNKGDTVFLSATPNKGYQFNQWSDGNTDNPRTIYRIDKDYTLTAQFGIRQCSWLVESNDLEMGAVYTDFTNEFYNYGTQITVEASANSGYKFVKWNDGKKHNPYKFSILEDKYLLALFIAEEEEADTTQVQPSDTTATFTWPFIVGGFTYTLTIYLDVACAIPFCTLTFNQYGQLTSITFGARVPRRSAMANQEEGFTTTINGLSAGTEYFYKMETKDEDGKLLNTDEGGFSTQNSGVITNTNKVKMSIPCVKFIKDNQLYIFRDNELYNAVGQKVK